MELTCWIIDDEPLAIELLKSYVAKTSFLKLTGTYSSAIQAMQDVTTTQVDIIFLDIQMPEVTGMEFAKFVKDETRIIFTTAFSEYAIDGYRVDALDYLLKPITYDSFLEATKKAIQWFELKQSAESNELLQNEQQYETEQMFVKAGHKLIRILFKDILYIEGWKDYVKIHLTNKKHPILSLMSMKKLEDEILPSSRFTRIHRSFIVQKNKIESISKNRVLVGNKELPIGESYKQDFMKAIS